jgi:RND family efflux transporter MFP subunit
MKTPFSLPLVAVAGTVLVAGLIAAVVAVRSPPPVAVAPPAARTAVPATVSLDPDQSAAAGIMMATAETRDLPAFETVPGVVQANAYRSALVSTRIPAVVQQRHATLGQGVREGQQLATLFSAEMAEAQSTFLLADREWRRVVSLGRDVVAGRRWTEAEMGRQTAQARLMTFGLPAAQIDTLAREGRARSPGLFTLAAPQAGTIAADSFRVGEMIEAGRPLFEIVDTATVWIEARVGIGAAHLVPPGATARVHAGGHEASATLRQILPRLDEQTRTLGVRFEAQNPDGLFTPGQFIQVEIPGPVEAAVTVPAGAVVRDPEGRSVVFVEETPGTFRPQAVAIGRSQGGITAVEGIAPGTRVVVAGAFFLQSELTRAAGGRTE